MPSVIAKSCNKLLVGKTYWESAALPSILHGSEVIYYSEAEIKRLQIEENKAYRYIVNARKSIAISALRGEIRASLQINRDVKSKILFIRHLLKDIFMKQLYEKKPTKWIKLVKKYMDTLQLNINMLVSTGDTGRQPPLLPPQLAATRVDTIIHNYRPSTSP